MVRLPAVVSECLFASSMQYVSPFFFTALPSPSDAETTSVASFFAIDFPSVAGEREAPLAVGGRGGCSATRLVLAPSAVEVHFNSTIEP